MKKVARFIYTNDAGKEQIDNVDVELYPAGKTYNTFVDWAIKQGSVGGAEDEFEPEDACRLVCDFWNDTLRPHDEPRYFKEFLEVVEVDNDGF